MLDGLKSKLSYVVPVATGMMAAAAFPALAVEGAVGSSADWSAVTTALTGQFSTATIVDVVGSTLKLTVPLGFCWFGIRFATRKLMGAFRNGNV